MSENPRHDDEVLDQIERLLGQRQPHDEAFINTLAQTRPQADQAVQYELEQSLMARLQGQPSANAKENDVMQQSSVIRRNRATSLAPLTWAVTVATVAIALVSIVLINVNRGWMPAATQTPAALVVQTDEPIALVVAAEEIPAGTEITESMLVAISLAPDDAEKLGITSADNGFIHDIQTVIGATAATAIRWFQPLENRLLGEPVIRCTASDTPCPILPDDYSTIGLITQPDTLQGLKIGDRVDVLTTVDDQIRVIVADIILSHVDDDRVILAAPSWKAAVLIRLSNSSDAYALRLHTGSDTKPADITPVEYVLSAPEALPDDYRFDLIVNVPEEQGYRLTGLPDSIDHLTFTFNGDTLHFWFTDIELVSVDDDSMTVTIRLPQDDAANLDYLIGLGMTLTFTPDLDSHP